MDKEEIGQNKQALIDIEIITAKAVKEGYLLGIKDIFALGFLAGKYGLTELINNKEEVKLACIEYDKTDALYLLDTIGETLIDLEIIDNKDKSL